jgi:hypothetical protein
LQPKGRSIVSILLLEDLAIVPLLALVAIIWRPAAAKMACRAARRRSASGSGDCQIIVAGRC